MCKNRVAYKMHAPSSLNPELLHSISELEYPRFELTSLSKCFRGAPHGHTIISSLLTRALSVRM